MKLLILALSLSLTAAATELEKPKKTYQDEVKTTRPAPERDTASEKKIDFNGHTATGLNDGGYMYSKEDDQERMEEAHDFLEEQRSTEGKGVTPSQPVKVGPGLR